MFKRTQEMVADLVSRARTPDDAVGIAELLLSGALEILDRDPRTTLAGAKLSEVVHLVAEVRQGK